MIHYFIGNGGEDGGETAFRLVPKKKRGRSEAGILLKHFQCDAADPSKSFTVKIAGKAKNDDQRRKKPQKTGFKN